jgi:hypothetical protein
MLQWLRELICFFRFRVLAIQECQLLSDLQVLFFPSIMFRKVSKMFGPSESAVGDPHDVQQVLGQKCVDLLSADVVSVESVDDSRGKYDVFVISVKKNGSGAEYKVKKRYSDFEAFRSLCVSEMPDVYFPGKKFNLLQMNAEKLERRRGKLDKFLKAVLSCKTMSMVLQCDVLNFLDAFVKFSIEPGTPLFTYAAVASTEFALTSSAQVSVAVVSVAKDTKADIVLYDVKVQIDNGTVYTVQHRFSAFQELHEKFKCVVSNLYFPGVHHLFVDAQKQESRRVKLDQWLKTIMSAGALPTDLQRELLRFLDLFNKMGLHPQVRAIQRKMFLFPHPGAYRLCYGLFLPVASKYKIPCKKVIKMPLFDGRVRWIAMKQKR